MVVAIATVRRDPWPPLGRGTTTTDQARDEPLSFIQAGRPYSSGVPFRPRARVTPRGGRGPRAQLRPDTAGIAARRLYGFRILTPGPPAVVQHHHPGAHRAPARTPGGTPSPACGRPDRWEGPRRCGGFKPSGDEGVDMPAGRGELALLGYLGGLEALSPDATCHGWDVGEQAPRACGRPFGCEPLRSERGRFLLVRGAALGWHQRRCGVGRVAARRLTDDGVAVAGHASRGCSPRVARATPAGALTRRSVPSRYPVGP